MSIKVQIPPQYAGNMVELDQTVTGINDTLLSPPSGRWRAIHNIDDEVVTVYAPENEVYRYIAENGDDRSDVYAPGNSGKLIEDTAKANFDGTVTAVDAGTTAAFTGKTNVEAATTITRGGVDITSQITDKPTFDGIDWDGSALTDIVVNNDGAGLEEGDVISFPVTDNTDVTITFTVGQDDLQLSPGFYVLKATTRKQILSLAAGESAYLNVSKIEIHATGDDAKVIAFFG